MVDKFLLVGLKADLPAVRDANKLYWCSDTRELYKGMDLYTEAVRVVSALPATMAQGVLYILPSGEVKMYDGSTTITVAKPYFTSADGLLTAANTDDQVATAKAVYDSITYAVGEVVKNGGIVNNVISTKAGTITVTKGDYNKLDSATAVYSASTTYFVKSGDAYVVETVADASDFATKVASANGLYVSADETDVAIKGVVVNPTYDASTRTITLPFADGTKSLEINLGKDIFLDPSAQNKYNPATGNIELYLNDGNGGSPTMISIPASDLVDIYTGGTHTDGSTTVTIDSNNEITASVNVSADADNRLSKKADGLYVDAPSKAQFASLSSDVDALEASLNGEVIVLKDNGAATGASYTFSAADTFTADGAPVTYASAQDLANAIATGSEQHIEVATAGVEDRVDTLETKMAKAEADIVANANAIADVESLVNDAVFVEVDSTYAYDANSTYYKVDSNGDFVKDTSIVDDQTLAAAMGAGTVYVLASDAVEILAAKVAQNAADIATNAADIAAVSYVQCTTNTVYDAAVTYYKVDNGAYVVDAAIIDEPTFTAAVAAGTAFTKTTDAVKENEGRIAAIENSLTWGNF